jgi:hypothetical protein
VIHEVVAARLESFTDPKKDVSYNERLDGHVAAFQTILDEPMGEGMGSVDTDHATTGGDASIGPHDSAILESLYALGLPGSLIYFFGIAAGGMRMMRLSRRRTEGPASEAFAISMRAIGVALFVQLVLNSIFVGPFGFLAWTAIGMTLAAGELSARPQGNNPKLSSAVLSSTGASPALRVVVRL